MSVKTNPKPGEKYKHFKGNLYEIVCTAKDADLVVYKSLKDGQIWARDIESWHERLTNEQQSTWRAEVRFAKEPDELNKNYYIQAAIIPGPNFKPSEGIVHKSGG